MLVAMHCCLSCGDGGGFCCRPRSFDAASGATSASWHESVQASCGSCTTSRATWCRQGRSRAVPARSSRAAFAGSMRCLGALFCGLCRRSSSTCFQCANLSAEPLLQVGEVLADIHTGGAEEEAPAAAAGAAGADAAGTAAAAAAAAQPPQQRGGTAAPSFAAGGVQAGSSSEDEQLGEGKVLTSPAVRHLAKQYGINLRKVGHRRRANRAVRRSCHSGVVGRVPAVGDCTNAGFFPSVCGAVQVAAAECYTALSAFGAGTWTHIYIIHCAAVCRLHHNLFRTTTLLGSHPPRSPAGPGHRARRPGAERRRACIHRGGRPQRRSSRAGGSSHAGGGRGDDTSGRGGGTSGRAAWHSSSSSGCSSSSSGCSGGSEPGTSGGTASGIPQGELHAGRVLAYFCYVCVCMELWLHAIVVGLGRFESVAGAVVAPTAKGTWLWTGRLTFAAHRAGPWQLGQPPSPRVATQQSTSSRCPLVHCRPWCGT